LNLSVDELFPRLDVAHVALEQDIRRREHPQGSSEVAKSDALRYQRQFVDVDARNYPSGHALREIRLVAFNDEIPDFYRAVRERQD